jgi:hypothetical protein
MQGKSDDGTESRSFQIKEHDFHNVKSFGSENRPFLP